MSVNERPMGTAFANSSYLRFVLVEGDLMSMRGASPFTVTVSVFPGSSVKLRVVRSFRLTTTSFRMTVLNPPAASTRTV